MVRTEIKVIIAVLLTLLAAEAASRMILPRSSHYQEHVHAIPQIAEDLSAEPDKKRVLLLGNSLFWHGLDEKFLQRSHQDLTVEKIAPSGSAILDWYYIVKSHLLAKDQLPEHIVIGFVAHHLDDSERVKYRPLARFFLTPSHFPELAQKDLATWDERGTAALSMVSSAIGDQPDIRPFMDGALAYDWEARTINDLLYEQTRAEAETAGGTPPSQSFTRLTRLLDLVADEPVRLTFVAMPKLSEWTPEPKLMQLIESYGHTLLDARHFAIDGEPLFQDDGYHLNADGKAAVSEWLGKELERVVRPSQ